MTNAVVAHGTVLIWNYLKVLEMVNLTGLSEARDSLDVTSHDSSDSYREFIAGLGDGGELSLEGNFITGDTNGQIALHTDMQAGTNRNCFLLLPMSVGQSMSFTAFAQGFEPSFPHDAKMAVSGSLKVTGKPVLLTTQSDGISDMTGIEENGETALSISPAIAAGTYEYTCTVNTVSTWVKLTVTAASHTIYIQGTSVASGVQSGEIALGAAGTDTVIWVLAYETNESPRLYKLTVTRPSS
jgi:predicted secreted protein